MTEAAEILRKAKELIQTKGWTQEHYARDADNQPVDYCSESAVCFCPLGAIWRACEASHGRVVYAAESAFAQAADPQGHNTIPEFNDAPNRTLAEVIATFDHATALAEKSDV